MLTRTVASIGSSVYTNTRILVQSCHIAALSVEGRRVTVFLGCANLENVLMSSNVL